MAPTCPWGYLEWARTPVNHLVILCGALQHGEEDPQAGPHPNIHINSSQRQIEHLGFNTLSHRVRVALITCCINRMAGRTSDKRRHQP